MGESKRNDEKKASKAGRQLSKLGASKGGRARGNVLAPEQRQDIARKAVQERWRRFYETKGITADQMQAIKRQREQEKIREAHERIMGKAEVVDKASLPYSLLRGELPLGNLRVECHVLNDFRRVLTQTELLKALTGGSATNFSR